MRVDVARQLTVRGVAKWFGGLSFQQQSEALAELQQQHDHARTTKRAELESQLAALGYAVPRKRGRPRSAAKTDGTVKMRRAIRRTKVKAKYRDKKSGETWSGRGRMASWLKAKEDAGEDIQKYLIS
jgi:DNA-binding protein H-NS